MQINNQRVWLLNVIKGAMIGSGFILPGISGGALSVVFGLYGPLIKFLAHPFKHFRQNFFFFLPVGIGGILGIFGLSFGVSYLLGNYENIVLWFFIGAIVGTIPAMWHDSGKQGRSLTDMSLMIIAFMGMTLFLIFGLSSVNTIEANGWSWLLAGILIGLGLVIPGLSPSNFLIYLGLYKGMSDGIKTGNLTVLVPMIIGVVLVILMLSKVMNWLFEIAYSKLFHLVFGIVMASTIMIVPTNYDGIGMLGFSIAAVLCVLGILLGWWMSRLEQIVAK